MSATAALVESAILARLKAAEGVLGFAWKTLDTFPDDFADAILDKFANLPTPAAWAVFGGWEIDQRAGDLVEGPAAFFVVVADKHAGKETAARHGGASQPGSYALWEGALRVLAGRSLGVDGLSPLEPASVRQVQAGQRLRSAGYSLYAVEFRTRLCERLPSVVDPDALGEFDDFHTSWTFAPPRALAPLPADAADDFTDHQELP